MTNNQLLLPGEEIAASHQLPELPNFVSILSNQLKDTFVGAFLNNWENMIFSVLIAIIISLVCYFGSRNKKLIPSGLQNVLEFFVESMRTLVTNILGHEGEKHLPFLCTLFIYLLTMNLFGFIPLMKSPSANLNITIAQGICVFIFVQYLNIRNMGLFGFLHHLAGSPRSVLGWCLAPLLFPIELLTQLSRPVTLAYRLFGNIFGEDVLIGFFTLMGVSLFSFINPLSLPLQTPFIFLGIFTSIVQALVFTLLTTVYILLSMPHAEEHES